MKKTLAISILLTLALISCANATKETSKNKKTTEATSKITSNQQHQLKRYALKSGIVKYKTSIKGKVLGSEVNGSGTETLYFKDWGAIELVEVKSSKTTHSKLFGKEKTETTTIHTMKKLDNGKSYGVDFNKNTIYLRRDPMMAYMQESNTDVGEAGKKMLKSMGGKIIGHETFLGYNCEIWDALGSKQWIYKGVTLKIETKVMGITTVKEAINATFNTTVATHYFKLPDFPIVKDAEYLDDAAYQKQQKETKASMQKMKNMSYNEFKQMMVEKDSETAKNMTEEEFKQSYKMFQSMLKNIN